MDFNEETKKLKHIVVMTILTSILSVILSQTFPIMLIFIPTIFIVIGISSNLSYCIGSVVATTITQGVLIDIGAAVTFFMLFGLTGIIIAAMINKKQKHTEIILGGIIVNIVSVAITITFINYIYQIDLIASLEEFLRASYKATPIVIDMGISQLERDQIAGSIIEYAMISMPSMVMLFATLVTAINYKFALSIMSKASNTDIKVPLFSKFRLPSNVIQGTVVIFLLSFAIRYFKILYYDTIFLNVALIASFVFFIQGVAVVIYFLNKLRVSKLLKAIIIVLLFINIVINTLIVIVGFLDSIFNFRKLNKEADL